MPQQDDAIGFTVEVRDALQHVRARSGTRRTTSDGSGHARCAVAGIGFNGSSGFSRARNSLSRIARSASASRFGAGQQRAVFVAQRQQAGRLQPDHRQVAAENVERAACLAARPVHHAGGEKAAAAAERTAAVFRHTHAIAGGGQHAQRGAQVLRLEPAIERVGEQDDVAARVRGDGCVGFAVAERVATPGGQGTRGGKPGDAFAEAAQQRGCGCADWPAARTARPVGA